MIGSWREKWKDIFSQEEEFEDLRTDKLKKLRNFLGNVKIRDLYFFFLGLIKDCVKNFIRGIVEKLVKVETLKINQYGNQII